jgi:hypothetical protein
MSSGSPQKLKKRATRQPIPKQSKRHWAASLPRSGTEFDPYAEIARFEERRGETLTLLQGMPEGAGERSGQHAELGTIAVAQLLNEFAFHDLGHIRQAMELCRAHVFYPEMGAYRGYYKVNP